jgi:dipeptidyl aminopeptidase/acylaminoacyl peptidase
MRRFAGFIILLIALGTWHEAPRAAPGTRHEARTSRRPISELDLLQFVWLADLQMSPDGQQIAMARVTVDRERDGYTSQIWVVPSNGSSPPRPLTSGKRDTMPRWSADGARLAFLRAIDKDGQTDPPQVYMLDLAGGEARPLTRQSEGVSTFTWSPDAKWLAVTSAVVPTMPVEPGRPKASDVRVITRATFRADGAGYRNGARRSRVFLVPVSDGATPQAGRPLAGVRIAEADPAFAPDGATLYFTARDVEETDFSPPKTLVFAALVSGGEPRQIARIDGSVDDLVPSPDGRTLAFQGGANDTPVRSYTQPDLFVLSTADGTVRNLTTAYDFDIGAGLTGDQRAPHAADGARPMWTPDGSSLLAVAAAQGRANIIRVRVADASIAPVTSGDHEVQSFSASRDGSTLASLAATPTNIGDVFVGTPGVGGSSVELKRITSVNQALFDQLEVPAPEQFWFTSFDGRKVQGWFVTPPGFDRTKKYPLILQIHGGPHSAYGYTFTHEFLAQAARGYVVAYVNPRGSTSYGADFGNVIQYHYPGDDYTDLMRAVDDLLSRGFVDRDRLGVTGGSGGGLLTNWIIGHTDRFHAAVSQRSIADWEAWWYAADFTLFQPSWFRKTPWQDRADYAARSPITYADDIHTPLMLVDGDADYRTPPTAGGEAMFRALKLRHVPVVMVRVPNEGHELSRSGQPWHRIDRLRHIANWFDKWLQGKSMPEYDAP